ncbi:MAG: glycosyltransferase family 2 protein [Spirulina sp. SIO3F2]|nr:glycosyltransferase family 2 protein [Spirulina sp. SIO3F2]
MTLPFVRLAVLLTCFNRKSKTLACLQTLFAQTGLNETTLTVYLVDDGSTDGTSAAVASQYPAVNVIPGTGQLFWNGGMHRAFAEALPQDYDGYIWLNDDTLLYPEAITSLLKTAQKLAAQGETTAIVAGSTRDAQTQSFTYGGMRQISPLLPPFKVRPVEPIAVPQRCDMMCGNIVLIPRAVAQKVGNLDPKITHYAGDWDYGLRAKQVGCTVWIAPGYQGTCADNPRPQPNQTVALAEGLNKIQQPKGLMLADVTLHPWEEWKHLMQRHGGWLWMVFWLLPYRRLWWQALRRRGAAAQPSSNS